MKLFIYGASGAGKEIYDLAKRINSVDSKYSEILFIDDFAEEEDFYGTKRIHFSSYRDHISEDGAEFIIAVGEPAHRKLLYDKVVSEGLSFATLIDKSVIITDTSKIGAGCVINSGAVISSDVTLEENCLVMYHAIIGHDAYVKRNTVICPMSTIGGASIVGTECFVGINSSMMQGVNLGDRVIVGMGSMVYRSVEDDATVVGNPARVTKGNSDHKVFQKTGRD